MHVALAFPIFAVIVTSSVPLTVIFPFLSITATLALLDAHVTFWSVASLGFITSFRVIVSPTYISPLEGVIETLSTGVCFFTTLTIIVAFLLFLDVAVIVVLPTDLAVTTPLADTVAIFVLLDLYVLQYC